MSEPKSRPAPDPNEMFRTSIWMTRGMVKDIENWARIKTDQRHVRVTRSQIIREAVTLYMSEKGMEYGP